MSQKNILILTLVFFLLPFNILAQEEDEKYNLPSVNLKDINGKTVNTAQIVNNEKPLILCFGSI